MAAFNRPTEATYEVHENITVDTLDNEDHTFCGIMFPVKCKDLLPLDHLVIKSVAVRGRLGPLTVWVSNPDQHRPRRLPHDDQAAQYWIRLDSKYWTKLYDKEHEPSRYEYKELVLETPIRLVPGETRVIYIHSTLPGDEAIVYDNSSYGQTSKRYEDDKLAIMTGRAHVSSDVFGQEPIWGWGNAWRDRREFVGRLNYGTVYKLWNPQEQPKFGGNFQDGARALLMCQRRWESPWSKLPDECLFYILNMCRWDWFDDDTHTMRVRRRKEKARLLRLREEAAREAAEEARRQEEVALVAACVAMEDEKPPACRTRRSKTTRVYAIQDDDDDEEEEDVNTASQEEEKKTACTDPDDDDVEMKEQDDDHSDDDDDDDDDDENFEEADDDDDEDDEAEWSDNDDQYHRANIDEFTYRDVDSDDDDNSDQESDNHGSARREWIRRQFARIHVLRALASMEDRQVTHVQS